MDTDAEERFDRLTRLASRLLGAPIVLLSLVGDQKQFFKSAVGLSEINLDFRETDIEHSFCRHVVDSGRPFVVDDARRITALKDKSAAIGVVAYAGVPLIIGEGQVIGSFCAIDCEPRAWTESDVALLSDLAESVMSEIRLQQAKDAAEAANRAKDRFLAVLSHELRMPISPALMIVQEMVTDVQLPQTVRDDADIVRRNIEQQVRLIDDLLDLTRIENGKLDVRLAMMDLRTVIRNAVDHFASDAAAKKVNLSCETCCEQSIVHGDSGRLSQVFGNLLKNAIKFTPAGGTVDVRLDRGESNAARVLVKDTGIGIPADVLPDLFEAFAQGPRARVREFGGLGLGLAIAKGIVEEHGGTIEVSSDGEQQGTSFTVTIPLASQRETHSADLNVSPAAGVANESPAPAEDDATPVRILLVDDHEDTLKAMTRLLRKLKHRVITAGNVTDALKVADDHDFDLLISDVGLPDGTGLDLMRQLLARRPLQGIALTGYGTEDDYRQTREAGFSAHLTKPIDMQSLAGAINVLSQKRDDSRSTVRTSAID